MQTVSSTLPQCSIKVIFRSKNQLSNLFKFKNSIPISSLSPYTFQCSNYSITFDGKTQRHIKVGAGEHISMSGLTGKRVNSNKNLP